MKLTESNESQAACAVTRVLLFVPHNSTRTAYGRRITDEPSTLQTENVEIVTPKSIIDKPTDSIHTIEKKRHFRRIGTGATNIWMRIDSIGRLSPQIVRKIAS